ncbi:two-component system activity regulator YycH, partial [Staphylococcus auricularis]|uniref:two-component system activity regulator YycH n=1 Tax=Staphylococcus auricularis TaxID=29379 RepID=UPI001CD9BD16
MTPYQLIHSNEPHLKPIQPHPHTLKKINKLIQHHKLTHTQHIHTDHNFMSPHFGDHFLVFHFSYHMPLSTYLPQVMNIDARVPNHFNFNPLFINHHHNPKLQMYPITKHPHHVLKIKSSPSATQFSHTLHNLHNKIKPYPQIITNKHTLHKPTHIFPPSQEQKLKS